MKIVQKNMSFGEVINALNAGRMVSRMGWNGKEMFLIKNGGYNVDLHSARDPINKEFLQSQKCENLTIEPHIDMWTSQKTLAVGWSPSQMDIFATDWCAVDPIGDKSKYDGMLHVYADGVTEENRLDVDNDKSDIKQNEGEGDHTEYPVSGGEEKSEAGESSRLDLFCFTNEGSTVSKSELNLMALKKNVSVFKIFSNNPAQLEVILTYNHVGKGGREITMPIILKSYYNDPFLLKDNDTLSDINCGKGGG